MPSALVIGTDGLIGSELQRRLQEQGWVTVGTTRRLEDGGRVHLDLANLPARLLSAPPALKLRSESSWTAFVLAGITGYATCAQDPFGTRRINVTNSIMLAAELVEAGAFVVYPSSSAVFGEAAGPFDESSLPSATTEYGRQKADAENGMLGLIPRAPSPGGVAVVRLTKVVEARGLVAQWMAALKVGSRIEAATNLWLSPVSLAFAVGGLIEIAAAGRSGIYHLAGEGAMSYFELATRLADVLGAERAQVRPVEIEPAHVPGAMRSVALNMSETTRYTKLSAQTVESVLLDLVSSS